MGQSQGTSKDSVVESKYTSVKEAADQNTNSQPKDPKNWETISKSPRKSSRSPSSRTIKSHSREDESGEEESEQDDQEESVENETPAPASFIHPSP